MQPLDHLPLLAFFIIVVIFALLAVEAGYLFGKHHRKKKSNFKEAPIGSAISSTLGLLAFMLAFTFGVAAARFDERRILVVDEADAIGTAYLRADFAKEPYRTNVRNLLRQYLSVEIDSLSKPKMLDEILAKSDALHDRLWFQTVAIRESALDSPVSALFIDSINNVIDIHTKRVAATSRARVPQSVWCALFLVAGLSMSGMGYYFGVSDSRSLTANIVLVAAFSTIMLLVVDLDRPWEGTLNVSREPLLDLKEKFGS